MTFSNKTGVLLVCLLSLWMISCRQSVNEWPAAEAEIDPSVLDEAMPLSPTLLFSTDNDLFWDAKEFFPLDDDNILIRTSAKSGPAFVYLYNVSSNCVIDSLFLNGNGPGEMLSCTIYPGSAFVFYDFIKRVFYVADIESILSRKDDFVKIECDVNPLALSSYPLPDSTYIYENSHCDPSFDGRYAEQYPRLRKSSDGIPKYGNKYRGIYNVSQGKINVNEKKDRLVYASSSGNLIEFYDLSLTPLVRLYGPKETRIDYNVTRENNAFRGFIPYAYEHICSTSDYIFLAYSGASPTVDELMQHDIEDSDYPAYVMQFDWDGNLKWCHMLKSLPYGIYVREGDNHTLYFTMSDAEGRRCLYSCAIP